MHRVRAATAIDFAGMDDDVWMAAENALMTAPWTAGMDVSELHSRPPTIGLALHLELEAPSRADAERRAAAELRARLTALGVRAGDIDACWVPPLGSREAGRAEAYSEFLRVVGAEVRWGERSRWTVDDALALLPSDAPDAVLSAAAAYARDAVAIGPVSTPDSRAFKDAAEADAGCACERGDDEWDVLSGP